MLCSRSRVSSVRWRSTDRATSSLWRVLSHCSILQRPPRCTDLISLGEAFPRRLAGDVHAFSDPDSNSGFLVTAAELARRGTALMQQPTIFSEMYNMAASPHQ